MHGQLQPVQWSGWEGTNQDGLLIKAGAVSPSDRPRTHACPSFLPHTSCWVGVRYAVNPYVHRAFQSHSLPSYVGGGEGTLLRSTIGEGELPGRGVEVLAGFSFATNRIAIIHSFR